MDVADKLQKVWIFFTDDGFVSVLEQVAVSLMAFIEGNSVTGHEAAHYLAKRCRTGAQ